MRRETIALESRYGMRTEDFSTLMQQRVLEVLLVASRYDAFMLEEDGQLTELLLEEYRNLDLNLRYAPRFARAETADEGLKQLAIQGSDMVVTTPRLGDQGLDAFLERVREDYPGLPVGLLAAHAWDLPRVEPLRASGLVDWVFLWQGNVTVLLAMLKQAEDRANADHDILEGGVQAIILVEDEVRFYSSLLPQIYTEITTQTARLMAEGLNLSHRLLRIRARPKILLAQSYEEAWTLYERYAGNILGIISDVSFPRKGVVDPVAGLKLAAQVRDHDPHMPMLLQSLENTHAQAADKAGVSFVHKGSSELLESVQHFIRGHFGFGDFVFRMPDRTEVARARDMREMVRLLPDVPDESLLFHAASNHFSAWLKARTEFELATQIRPRDVSEFSTADELRSYLKTALKGYLREIQSHVITEFDSKRFDGFAAFAKVGVGSLGGKGRGLAFMHKLLAMDEPNVPGVELAIPQTLVLATDVFDAFVHANGLRDVVREVGDGGDQEILDRFRAARPSREVRSKLARFLRVVHGPLAVRSSSLLEDSVYQPFAGVYSTVMVPNCHPSPDVRLAQLLEAVKVVYASTYFEAARDYLESTPYRLEEESMAVLIQRLVGKRWGDRFYPTLSGTASSYNFYPFGGATPEDGVAQIALGLGKSVVEGFEALRFCPRHPEILPQFSATQDILRNAQRRFYALDMSRDDAIPGMTTDANLLHVETMSAVADGAAHLVGSTYSRQNDTVSEGISRDGAPLITFASLLKGRVMPLPEILDQLLDVCQRALGSATEIEFAAQLEPGLGRVQTFNIVQVRPMVMERMQSHVELGPDVEDRAVVTTEVALGHGRRETLSDIIVVDRRRLNRSMTPQVASVVADLNAGLRDEGRHCLLVGPGRWGSRDPWLGIPVSWSQISSVRAIVETDFLDLEVEPSLGSHFFHNLVCFGVAFFAVHAADGRGRIEWDWFRTQPEESRALDGIVRHLRLEEPVQVLVDGESGKGVILRP
jgi:hypothetical protein